LISKKKKAFFVLIIATIAATTLWAAGHLFRWGVPPAQFQTRTFHPKATGEPISPIPKSLSIDMRKAALGKRLFHDSRLSADNSLACATCHVLNNWGVDGTRLSRGVRGQHADRNTPTVFNAVFNFRQFWDGRAATLEDQVDGPIHNPKEMASNWQQILDRLGKDAHYRSSFKEVYGGMTADAIRNAIAEFERSLVTPGSRFDRYLEGDEAALKEDEIRGYQLFKSYGCIACHQGVNVGGNLYERLGVVRRFNDGVTKTATADVGRMAISGRAEDMLVFKVPSLRNVAQTAPYFHDGSVQTLEQAVAIMGQYQLGVAIPHGDVTSIVKFLGTLTGHYEDTVP
jgi:cytochrome c peroxidase